MSRPDSREQIHMYNVQKTFSSFYVLPEPPSVVLFRCCSALVAFSTKITEQVRWVSWWLDWEAISMLIYGRCWEFIHCCWIRHTIPNCCHGERLRRSARAEYGLGVAVHPRRRGDHPKICVQFRRSTKQMRSVRAAADTGCNRHWEKDCVVGNR